MQIPIRSVGPAAAFLFLVQGLKLLNAPGLRRYVWFPILINVVLYSAGFWLASRYFTAAMHWLVPAWLDWLRWLLWPLFALLLLATAFFTFTLMTNLLGSPLYGRLTEQVRRLQASGQIAAPGSEHSALASLFSESRRLGYFALRALPLLALFLIPLINVIAPFLWMLFGAWSLSLDYMAYPLEARGLLFKEQRDVVRKRRLDMLAFGGAVMLGLAIPLLNIFIPPAAVIGATLYILEAERRGEAL
ncbi:sulfate transporter CysZ [Methyloterricola oryzae]|uniref:sulfate transporter CysZ n=1 Tax=Methyloterricola oryzae TaxID=1495050 RepID=UPI0005EB8465|nr:sulfate transporter CysZ [Methyloterricola oryzae]